MVTQAPVPTGPTRPECAHTREHARLGDELLRLRGFRRKIRLALPTVLGGRPELQEIDLFFWAGAWRSDALIAVRFGGETVYARALRLPNGSVSIPEQIVRDPASILDDEFRTGTFRGVRPEVLGWAARRSIGGVRGWRGIAVDAAAANCSPDISSLVETQIAEVEMQQSLFEHCGCHPEAARQAAIDEAARQRLAHFETMVQEIDSSIGVQVMDFAGRVARVGLMIAVTPLQLARGLVRIPLTRVRLRTALRQLSNPGLNEAERTDLEARIAEFNTFLSDRPVDVTHEVGASEHLEELVKLRRRIDAKGEEIRTLRRMSSRSAQLVMAGLVWAGTVPIVSIIAAPIAIHLIGDTLVIRHARDQRGKAHAAYVRAAAASRRGDRAGAYRWIVEGNGVLEGAEEGRRETDGEVDSGASAGGNDLLNTPLVAWPETVGGRTSEPAVSRPQK